MCSLEKKLTVMAFAENEVPSSWLLEALDVGSRCFQVMIRCVDDAKHIGQDKILRLEFRVNFSGRISDCEEMLHDINWKSGNFKLDVNSKILHFN